MPTPLAFRFVHLEIRVDASDWGAWGTGNGIAPEVLFFVQMRPELLHQFDPQSAEKAFPCPRTWEFVSNIVHRRNGLDPAAERALFLGAVGEAAAVEFYAFLKVWRDLPHPRTVIDDPENAPIPDNASALIALCGSLYRLVDDVNLGAIVTYADRLRREVGEFLVGSCTRREPTCSTPRPSSSGLPPEPADAIFREINPMDLTRDAMLVSLRINAWSGRLYDREASRHVAIHHDASTSAGRYNKRLLPKSAFAELTETMGKARTAHYANTLPWDDQGSRLLTVANYDRYTAVLDDLIERMVGERALFIEDYDNHIERARLDLGRLFRVGDYPAKEALQGKFGIAYRILPVPDARHFMADLAADETARVKHDIRQQVQVKLHDALGDLYRRLGKAVERVGERLREDENGKPLVFRDSMIKNVREGAVLFL